MRRTLPEGPARLGRHGGLAYALWLPEAEPRGSVLILHGAGSAMEVAVAELRCPLLILHAEGDERVPADHSAELHRAAGSESKRLLIVPGGHHRSIQHDGELQGESLRFIARAFAAAD